MQEQPPHLFPHAHTYISTSMESSHKDQRLATVKERFYAKKKNLQSKVIKINVKEQRQKMYVWQRIKMYEHVGKATNLQRRSYDKRQMNNHNNKEQRKVMM